MSNKSFETELVIIGAGASGLMAGILAGNSALNTVIVEKKNRPGKKILLCGNSRCNLTTNISPDSFLKNYDFNQEFIKHSLLDFSPAQLQRWFADNGLKTVVKTGSKVYPITERATDVLNFLLKHLSEKDVSLFLSSNVLNIEEYGEGFKIVSNNFVLYSRYVMLATGGVSFPQTGSTGDGYELAKKFGHKIVEPKPGLVGYDLDIMKLKNKVGFEAKKVVAKVICDGKSVFETFGVYKVEQWGVAGTAINNTTRYISHNSLKKYKIQVVSDGKLIDQFTPKSIRPLKEAQVTVGGIDLEDVNPITMESKLKKGLFFGGEVLNIDGPTGGYNLHFAFASARQVVKEVAKRFSYKFDDKLTCVVEKKNNRRKRGEGRANTYKRNRKQRARN